MQSLYILNGKRTPMLKYMGGFSDVSAVELGAHSLRAVLADSNLQPDQIDHVIYGNVIQSSPDAIYLARHIGLEAGLPDSIPALTVNRLCGSGAQALISGAHMILAGEAEIVAAGGTENMTQAPYVLRNARGGYRLGNGKLEDMLMESLTDSWPGMPMAVTAEKLADQYAISREEQDQLAVRSHQRATAARKEGRLAEEIEPVTVSGRKGDVVYRDDDNIREDVDSEALARLRPVFTKDGCVTAGNASGIGDGAASLIIASVEAAKAWGGNPLGRIVSWGVAAVDPSVMGIGPVPAVKQALERAGLKLADIDRIELNEAFAAQYLAVEKELGLNPDITNVNGGAIALSHPLGMTAARLVLTVLMELRRSGGRYGLATACIGGGQGIAMVVERC